MGEMIRRQVIHDIDLSDWFGVHCVKLIRTTNDYNVIPMYERLNIRAQGRSSYSLGYKTLESIHYIEKFLK